MPRATTHHIHLPRIDDDHRVTLYRRADVGESHWFMRVYLKDEGRYFRKSLKTHDQQEAEKLGQRELISLLGRKQAGQLALSISISKLVTLYLKELEHQLEHHEMRPATHKNACRRIDLCRRFLEAKLKHGVKSLLSAFDGSIFEKYLEWRWSVRRIRKDVAKQELLTIKRMFTWAQKKRPPLCSEKAIPVWHFKVEAEKAKRNAIKLKDCNEVLLHARLWAEERTTPKQSYYRRLMFYVLTVMNHSGMRTGEVLNLSCEDVGELGKDNICEVTIHGANTKVKKTRVIAVGVRLSTYGGYRPDVNYLAEWKTEHAPHKEASAYVFSSLEKGQGHMENAFDKTYAQFREQRLKQSGLGHVQPYHMRHAFISDRMRANVPIAMIAAHCGTSIRMISQTYSQITSVEASKQIAKARLIYREGGDYSIDETGS
jgi:integrase